MITLAYEVWQQKKQEQNQVTQISSDNSNAAAGGEKNKIINVGNKKIMLEEYDSKQHSNSENNMGLPTISGFY